MDDGHVFLAMAIGNPEAIIRLRDYCNIHDTEFCNLHHYLPSLNQHPVTEIINRLDGHSRGMIGWIGPRKKDPVKKDEYDNQMRRMARYRFNLTVNYSQSLKLIEIMDRLGIETVYDMKSPVIYSGPKYELTEYGQERYGGRLNLPLKEIFDVLTTALENQSDEEASISNEHHVSDYITRSVIKIQAQLPHRISFDVGPLNYLTLSEFVPACIEMLEQTNDDVDLTAVKQVLKQRVQDEVNVAIEDKIITPDRMKLLMSEIEKVYE